MAIVADQNIRLKVRGIFCKYLYRPRFGTYWADISVDDVLRMKVAESTGNLSNLMTGMNTCFPGINLQLTSLNFTVDR